MIPRRRTGNGAAFAFFAGLVVMVVIVAAASTGCSSAIDDALDGYRGGDAVVTPTPDPAVPVVDSEGTPAPEAPAGDEDTVEATSEQATEDRTEESVDESGIPDDDHDESGIPDDDHAVMTAAWIYDGDTFRAKTEHGRSVDVRLVGINAPESDECFGKESTDILIDLIGREQVTVSTVAFDEYGRRLADVTFGDLDVNLAMVAQGAALTLHSDRGERLAALSRAEEQARELQAGMWGAGCMSEASVAIETVNYDAEGRDDVNVNGEWVVVINNGPDIGLGGWGLRDESTRHRYEFPDDLILRRGERAIIYSGCSTDPPPIGTPPHAAHTFYWCDPWGPLWTNRGDSAYLIDADGATVDIFGWS